MTLRSSPRKRLLITDITPISPEQSFFTTPRKSNSNQLKQTFPGGKRLKFDMKPIAQTNTDVPLTETLSGKKFAVALITNNNLFFFIRLFP